MDSGVFSFNTPYTIRPDELARNLEQAYPKSNKGWKIQVDSFQEWLINNTIRSRLLLLFGAVILVLIFRPQGLLSARGTKERV